MTRSADDLPPALPSLWRTIKLGYRAEPKGLVLAFAMTVASALPDAMSVKAVTSTRPRSASNALVNAAYATSIVFSCRCAEYMTHLASMERTMWGLTSRACVTGPRWPTPGTTT